VGGHGTARQRFDPVAAHRIHEGFRPSYILFILRITQHFRLQCRSGVARATAFDFAGRLWLRPQRRWGRPCTRRPCRLVSSRELSATSLTWLIPDSIAALAPSSTQSSSGSDRRGGLRTGSAIRRHSPHRSRSAWVCSVREDSRPSYSRSAWTLSSPLIRLRRALFQAPAAMADVGAPTPWSSVAA
jgi:hypothetical protein